MYWLVQLQRRKLISHAGCCYDCAIQDSFIIINYHVYYMHKEGLET